MLTEVVHVLIAQCVDDRHDIPGYERGADDLARRLGVRRALVGEDLAARPEPAEGRIGRLGVLGGVGPVLAVLAGLVAGEFQKLLARSPVRPLVSKSLAGAGVSLGGFSKGLPWVERNKVVLIASSTKCETVSLLETPEKCCCLHWRYLRSVDGTRLRQVDETLSTGATKVDDDVSNGGSLLRGDLDYFKRVRLAVVLVRVVERYGDVGALDRPGGDRQDVRVAVLPFDAGALVARDVRPRGDLGRRQGGEGDDGQFRNHCCLLLLTNERGEVSIWY